MSTNNSSSIDPEFQYIVNCFDALNEKRYRYAIRILDEGLNKHLNNPEQLNVTALLKHVSALINYLEFRLEEDFKIGLDEQTVKESLKLETRCSFCGERQSETKPIVGGPGIYICADCIRSCSDILAKR